MTIQRAKRFAELSGISISISAMVENYVGKVSQELVFKPESGS